MILMKTSEYRAWDSEKINQEIVESRKEFIDLRFQHSTGQLENTARLNTLRKKIARLMTILNERNNISE